MCVRGAFWILMGLFSTTVSHAMHLVLKESHLAALQQTAQPIATPLKQRALGLSVQKNNIHAPKVTKSSQCSELCKIVLQERLFVQAVKDLDWANIKSIMTKIDTTVTAVAVDGEHKDVDTPMLKRVHVSRSTKRAKKEVQRNIRRLFELEIDNGLKAMQYCMTQMDTQPDKAYPCLVVLLQYGIGEDATTAGGETLLHLAAEIGDVRGVKYLVKRLPVKAQDALGMTPLHYACQLPRTEHVAAKIVELLLEHGAAIEAKDKKLRTPLMFACAMGNWSTVQKLLDNKANVNALDTWGNTALHYLVGCDDAYFKDGNYYRQFEPKAYGAELFHRIQIIKDLVGYRTLLVDDDLGHNQEEVARDHYHDQLYEELHRRFGLMGKDEQAAASICQNGRSICKNGHSIELHSFVADV